MSSEYSLPIAIWLGPLDHLLPDASLLLPWLLPSKTCAQQS